MVFFGDSIESSGGSVNKRTLAEIESFFSTNYKKLSELSDRRRQKNQNFVFVVGQKLKLFTTQVSGRRILEEEGSLDKTWPNKEQQHSSHFT